MRKKLIALAVAGLASTAVHAQTSVTIYGSMRPSVDFINIKEADRGHGTFMRDNSSRIGFSGSEDLGNGLKAIFQLESRVTFDERGTGAALTDRDSWLGLAGSFGSFTVGNHSTAYNAITGSPYDPFFDTIADYNSLMGGYVGPGAGGGINLNDRVRNSFYYASPVFSGFKLDVSYALKTEGTTAAAEDDNVTSLAGSYTNGPFNMILAFEHQGDGNVDDAEVKGWKVGAKYKFGFGTTVYGIFEKIKRDLGDIDIKNFYLAASHPITSKLDLNASYIHASDSDGDRDDGAQAWNAGVNYQLSKRTSFQVLYASVNNRSDGRYGLTEYKGTMGGTDVSGFSLRMRHNF